MIFGKKIEADLLANAETQEASPSYREILWQRFCKIRTALWSLRILYGLIFIALFADFIANEKPLFCKLDGAIYFPVIKQYSVDLGWSEWEAKFQNTPWQSQEYEAVIYPPIPYSGNTLDLKNSHYKSPFDEQDLPSWRFRHWLGTDALGHDVAAGMVAGTRVAMLVGLIAMSIASIIGILLGSLAGFFGDYQLRVSPIRLIMNIVGLFFAFFYGFQARSFALAEGTHFGWELIKSLVLFMAIVLLANLCSYFLEKGLALRKKMRLPIDLLVMRLIEVMNAIPGLLLLLAIVAIIEQSSIFYIMAIIGLIRWTGIARFIRAEMLRIRNLNYIEAARALGFSQFYILMRHAIPNALTPVMITVAFGIASTILLESTLSFLSIGVGPEEVTWGKLLAAARRNWNAWWMAIFPGMAIFVTVTIFNLIGDGLTRAMGLDR